MLVEKLLDAAGIVAYYPRLWVGSILVGVVVALAVVLLGRAFGFSIGPAYAGVMGGIAAGIFAARLRRHRGRG